MNYLNSFSIENRATRAKIRVEVGPDMDVQEKINKMRKELLLLVETFWGASASSLSLKLIGRGSQQRKQ